jgi:nitroimidazol reductase NimA-like FMN-containing flavoprotein (pyridoxamine 5'-phosphate oxidase superfamily)
MQGILNETRINEVLENSIVGRLGYTNGERIFIIPISYFFYNRKYIIAHSREGQKIEILRKNPVVCLEVDLIHNLSNWESVILWGKYEEITSQPDRHYALDLLIRKINQQKIKEMQVAYSEQSEVDESTVLPDREKSIVYRIKVENKSGRFERSWK